MASGVLNTAGGWLDAHPEANEVLTAAGMQGSGAETSVRDYFVAHPQDYQELRGIAAPLIDMQHGCGAAIQPMQIAALYQALSQSGAPINAYMRPWRLRTKLYAPKAAIPSAATTSRTLPNGA